MSFAYGEIETQEVVISGQKTIYSQFFPLFGTFNIDMEYKSTIEIHSPKTITAGTSEDILITPIENSLITTFSKDDEVISVIHTELDLGNEQSIDIPETIVGEVYAKPVFIISPSSTSPGSAVPNSITVEKMATQKIQVFVDEEIGPHDSVQVSIPIDVQLVAGGVIDLAIGEIPVSEEIFLVSTTPKISKTINIIKEVNTKLSLQIKDGTESQSIQVFPVLTDQKEFDLDLESYAIEIYIDGVSASNVKPNEWSSDISITPGSHNIQARFSESRDTDNNAIIYQSSESKTHNYLISVTEEKTTVKLVCPEGMIEEDGDCVEESFGGGCLIATATFGTELAPQVQLLREIRDNNLLSTTTGTAFMNSFNDIYYSFSPTIADLERQSPMFRETVKLFITPMLSTLSIMELAQTGSEEQVLGYGIAIMLLNVGIYIVTPFSIVFTIKKIANKKE